jgi:Uma2 family endonuclease
MSVTIQPAPMTTPPSPAISDVPIYRLTVEQYHAMARAGILTEDDPVELLEGWLVQKMTKYRPHVIATELLRRALEHLPPSGWYVAIQGPTTTVDSEPEPDLAIVRGDVRDYPDRHPGPTDVALVVEVADSSLREDRGAKKRLYARAGISVYWIVNLIDRRIELYTDPSGPVRKPDYRRERNYGADDMVPVVLNGVEVGSMLVSDLLP